MNQELYTKTNKILKRSLISVWILGWFLFYKRKEIAYLIWQYQSVVDARNNLEDAIISKKWFSVQNLEFYIAPSTERIGWSDNSKVGWVRCDRVEVYVEKEQRYLLDNITFEYADWPNTWDKATLSIICGGVIQDTKYGVPRPNNKEDVRWKFFYGTWDDERQRSIIDAYIKSGERRIFFQVSEELKDKLRLLLETRLSTDSLKVVVSFHLFENKEEIPQDDGDMIINKLWEAIEQQHSNKKSFNQQ